MELRCHTINPSFLICATVTVNFESWYKPTRKNSKALRGKVTYNDVFHEDYKNYYDQNLRIDLQQENGQKNLDNVHLALIVLLHSIQSTGQLST